MGKVSHMERTLKRLRDEGYLVAKVEHWNPFAHKRQDLFGFIDVLAIKKNQPILAVQVCGDDSRAAHVASLESNEAFRVWRYTGLEEDASIIQVWSWGKHGAKGKRKVWTVNITEL